MMPENGSLMYHSSMAQPCIILDQVNIRSAVDNATSEADKVASGVRQYNIHQKSSAKELARCADFDTVRIQNQLFRMEERMIQQGKRSDAQ